MKLGIRHTDATLERTTIYCAPLDLEDIAPKDRPLGTALVFDACDSRTPQRFQGDIGEMARRGLIRIGWRMRFPVACENAVFGLLTWLEQGGVEWCAVPGDGFAAIDPKMDVGRCSTGVSLLCTEVLLCTGQPQIGTASLIDLEDEHNISQNDLAVYRQNGRAQEGMQLSISLEHRAALLQVLSACGHSWQQCGEASSPVLLALPHHRAHLLVEQLERFGLQVQSETRRVVFARDTALNSQYVHATREEL